MRRLALCVAVLMFGVERVHGLAILDQSHEVHDGSASAAGGNWLGQTFTVGIAGQLSRIEVRLHTTDIDLSPTRFELRRAGYPPLASTIVPVTPNAGFEWVPIDLNAFELNVLVGEVLAIAVDQPAGSWSLDHLNGYEFGSAFGGVSGDFNFRTFVAPTLTSVTTGNWNAAFTWDGGIIPDDDNRTVVGSHTVTLAADGDALSLLINDSGEVVIGAGNTLSVIQHVTVNDSTLGIASSGTLNVGAELTVHDGSVYAVELGGPDNGVIAASGDVALFGDTGLTVQTESSLEAWGDTTRTIITAAGDGGITGTFTDVPDVGDFNLPWWDPERYGTYLGHGIWFGNDKTGEGVTYVEEGGVVTAVQIAVFQAQAGDVDGERDVDFADFNYLANGYTGSLSPGTGGKEWHQGDFDGDGDVDFGDFNHLANNYTGPGGGDKAIPEPSTVVLLCISAAGLLAYAARRQKRAA